LIWRFSVDTFLQREHAIVISLRDSFDASEKLPTLETIQDAIQGGLAIGCKSNSLVISMLTRKLITAQSVITDIISKTGAFSLEELLELKKRLDIVSQSIKLRGHYAIAKIESHAMKLHMVESIDSEETKYCWCRGYEDGKMVCCDGCDEWYHYECVGLLPPASGKPKRRKKSIMPSSSGNEGESDQVTGEYLCIYCADVTCKQYKYKWS